MIAALEGVDKEAINVVYLLHHGGIASRTPEGWASTVLTPSRDGAYEGETLNTIAAADVLVVGLEPVTQEVIAAAPRLRLIQRLGVGYDNIDLCAAADRGVPVCNMPHFNAVTVAEHTLMMVLALLRRAFDSNLLMKMGRWPAVQVASGGLYDLQGKTFGIIGLGAIGGEVARLAAAFGVRLLYSDPVRRPPVERELGAERVSLAGLLERSDIVSVHAPQTADTEGLIGAAELKAMKPTAFLVNTARGRIVDEDALVEALTAGDLAGAALDVFAEEPLAERHPLRRCPNVLLTPHTAGQTREAMERMVAALRENLLRVAEGREPLYQVASSAPRAGGAAADETGQGTS